MISPTSPLLRNLGTTDARPHHVINSLTFKGAHLYGNTRFELVDGLNCVIGTLGTGKTTFVQSIRHGIGAPPTDARAKQNHAQVVTLLGGGEIVLEVTTAHGADYVSERKGEEPPRVTGAAGAVPVSLDSDLFEIEVYAQNRISAMADDTRAQLALIDKFARGEIRAYDDAIAEVERKLGVNDQAIRRLEEEIEEGLRRTGDLPSVAAALASLSQAAGGDIEGARRAHEAKVLRGREQAMLRGLRDNQRAVLASASSFEVVAEERLGGEMSAPLAASENLALLAAAHAQTKHVGAVAREAMGNVRRAVAAAETAITVASDALGAEHAKQDAAYEDVVRQYDVDRGRVAERDRLRRQFLELEAIQKRVDERRRDRDARIAERRAMLAERAEGARARRTVRVRVGKEIAIELDGEIEVEIVAGGDVVDYLALLIDITKGENFRTPKLLEEIARRIRPEDLAALIRANDTAPLIALDESATNKAGRAQRLIDIFRESGRVHEIEIAPALDLPVIKLKVEDDYIATAILSTGQRCTAILPILLIQSAAPLIIDQPEDQVDNAYIFRVLVPTLLRVKKARQIIFTTHNPNILVLAEAERVFALEGKGKLKESGTLDELREVIEEYLEGGREAFLLRSKRYGHT